MRHSGETADKIEAAVKAAPDYAPGKPLLVRFDKLDDVVAWAGENAREGDIVVLAGKGHETYQEINGVKHPFDEKVVVAELLEELRGE